MTHCALVQGLSVVILFKPAIKATVFMEES